MKASEILKSAKGPGLPELLTKGLGLLAGAALAALCLAGMDSFFAWAAGVLLWR